MVCHTTLLKSVKRAKTVNARMGVSMTTAEVEGIEEPNNVINILLVHNKKGIRCVWMFTWQDGVVSHAGHSERKEHIQVSLCKAKIDATMRGHLLRGMKLRGNLRMSNRPGAHVIY